MPGVTEQLVGVINKPPARRLDHEMDMFVPWLRKKAKFLTNVQRDVILDIIRNCEHKKLVRDHIIIKQGDIGDCFYVMLTGRTSVYIDTVKTDNEDDRPQNKHKPPDSVEPSDIVQSVENGGNEGTTNFVLDRSRFGKFIIHFEAGQGFGEIALMTTNAERNASIIADEETDLLIINRDLFNRTVKVKQEQDYKERQDFIQASPFFCNWSNKFKRLLQMSLRKRVLPYNTILVKQGDPVIGLHFLIKGQAKVIIEPAAHEIQFQKLMEKEEVAKEEIIGRPSTAVARIDKNQEKDNLTRDQIRIRRHMGYAAAERRLAQKTIDLCLIEEPDVIGDIELSVKLHVYHQTVFTTSDVEVFILDNKNIDRFMGKRYLHTAHKIRDMAEQKLRYRCLLLHHDEVKLFQKLLGEIEHSKPSGQVSNQTEKPKTNDLYISNLVDLFLHDRTPLVQPCVPNSVFYMHKTLEPSHRQIRHLNYPHIKTVNKPVLPKRRIRSNRELKEMVIGPPVPPERHTRNRSPTLTDDDTDDYDAISIVGRSQYVEYNYDSRQSSPVRQRRSVINWSSNRWQHTGGMRCDSGNIKQSASPDRVLRRVTSDINRHFENGLQGDAVPRARAQSPRQLTAKPRKIKSASPSSTKTLTYTNNSMGAMYSRQAPLYSSRCNTATRRLVASYPPPKPIQDDSHIDSLNDRIKDFMGNIDKESNTGRKKSVSLHDLRKFCRKGGRDAPLPGGKVLICRKPCYKESSPVSREHNHVNHHMLQQSTGHVPHVLANHHKPRIRRPTHNKEGTASAELGVHMNPTIDDKIVQLARKHIDLS